MISTKSYHWVLPHVFSRNKMLLENLTFPHILRKFPTLFPRRMEYEKALVSSYYHNNDT